MKSMIIQIRNWLSSEFPCILQIYAWFFMQCGNHHSDSHVNHAIIAFNSDTIPGAFSRNDHWSQYKSYTLYIVYFTYWHPFYAKLDFRRFATKIAKILFSMQ